MNYNVEKEHDKQLVHLVKALAAAKRLDILQEACGIDHLSELRDARPRTPFDVQLTFSNNLSIVIETKVDSNEHRNGEKWQTEDIAERAPALEYLRGHRLVFLFITYGTSEFYMKPDQKPYQTGAASPAFKHIGLNDMINLVSSAVDVLPRSRSEDYQEWLRLMCIEREKRNRAIELLRHFSVFRKEYLDISNENDFPRNRLAFYAPELAFPVLGALAQQWNGSSFAEEFGRLSLYPVARKFPPYDSVLNFGETLS